jgi:HSP20 family protein
MVMSALYGNEPFRDTRRLQDEINRLLQGAAASRGGFPGINVYANPDGIVITAELPGVKQDDLEITVHRDTVTLRGNRQNGGDKDPIYHRRERGRGPFVRTFGLPFQVDTEKVTATLADGVLILSLQRPEADKPKRVQVGAGRD